MAVDLKGASASIRGASIAQMGSKLVSVAAQLVVTMILARLLTPEEYGVMAILTVFAGLFSVLADAGISTAIAQFQDLKQSDYERLFFFSLILGLILSAAFFVASFGIAWFYGDRIYVPLGAVMAFAVLFNSLNMVPNGVLIKKRQFKLIGLRLILCTIVVGAVVIALAFTGLGCFAIALQSVLTSLFVLVWNLATSRLRMAVGDFRPVLKKVGSFSLYQFGHEAIVWLSGNADSLLAGKLFGPAALGYYNKAYSLYGYPGNILAAPIASTLIPFLAPLQNGKPALRAKFVGVMRKASLICALCTVGMSVCSTELIVIMFGDAWLPAAPLLQILALAIYARGVNSVHAPLLSASNRPDLLMCSTLVNTAITLSFIFLGGFLGSVDHLAACVAIAYNLELIIPVLFCSKYCLSMKLGDYLKVLLPDMGTVVLSLVVCSLVVWPSWGVLASLVVKGIACIVLVLVFSRLLRLFVK